MGILKIKEVALLRNLSSRGIQMHVMFYGIGGAGKSYMMEREYLLERSELPVMILDVTGEYDHFQGRSYIDYVYFNMYNFTKQDIADLRTRIFSGPIVFIIDEMQLITENCRALERLLLEAVTIGRKYGINMVMLTQRPSAVTNKTFHAQCQTKIIFALDSVDINYLVEKRSSRRMKPR